MKRLIAVVLMILATLACGSATSATPTVAPQAADAPTEESTEEPTEEPTEATTQEPPAEPLVFSGEGAGITPSFSTLLAPLMIARVTHGGDGFFSFDAMDVATDEPASFISVAQGIGVHSGSGIISVQSYHRKIYIEVEADGPWTIEAIPATAQVRTEQLEFSGEGDIVTSAFLLEEGRVDVAFANEAKDSILVHMIPVDGDSYTAETVVNDVGPYNGVTTVRAMEDGYYILSVRTEGPWTATVSQP